MVPLLDGVRYLMFLLNQHRCVYILRELGAIEADLCVGESGRVGSHTVRRRTGG